MGQYLLKNDLFDPETGKILKTGEVLELDDESDRVSGLLERGTVAPFTEGEELAPVLDAFQKAELETNARHDADAARENVGQVVVNDEEKAEDNTFVPPASDVTAPTPEQLAADFQAAGAQTSPVVPPQE